MMSNDDVVRQGKKKVENELMAFTVNEVGSLFRLDSGDLVLSFGPFVPKVKKDKNDSNGRTGTKLTV